MSSGVTGKCGDIDGVWIDPVMAQVMMVLDFLRKIVSFGIRQEPNQTANLRHAEVLGSRHASLRQAAGTTVQRP
jgi:hypothetical protein